MIVIFDIFLRSKFIESSEIASYSIFYRVIRYDRFETIFFFHFDEIFTHWIHIKYEFLTIFIIAAIKLPIRKKSVVSIQSFLFSVPKETSISNGTNTSKIHMQIVNTIFWNISTSSKWGSRSWENVCWLSLNWTMKTITIIIV